MGDCVLEFAYNNPSAPTCARVGCASAPQLTVEEALRSRLLDDDAISIQL